MDAEFGRGVAEGNVVVVVEAGDGGDLAADVVFFGRGGEVFDGWMFGVTAEDFLGFFLSMKRLGGGQSESLANQKLTYRVCRRRRQ